MTQEAELAKLVRGYNGPESYGKLIELARPHIDANRLFEALPYDPGSPIHDLATVSLEPAPSSVTEIKELLDTAYRDWREVILPAFDERLVNEIINRIRIDRSPLSLLLAHERIEDVAFVAAAFVVLVSERIPYEELIQRMHLVISSIIRTVGAFGEPAAEILRKIGWVHFSFPRTESIRRSGFTEELVSAANRLMRMEVGRSPNRVMAVAGPGSVDRVFSLPARLMTFLPEEYKDRHTTSHIQPVRAGTAKLLEGYTLPVAAVFSGDRQFCRVGQVTWVNNLENVHALMQWIADERHSHTLVPTYYHREPSRITKIARLPRRR